MGMKYEILRSTDSIEGLEKQIIFYLSRGWKLKGNFKIEKRHAHSYYYQAMVKDE